MPQRGNIWHMVGDMRIWSQSWTHSISTASNDGWSLLHHQMMKQSYQDLLSSLERPEVKEVRRYNHNTYSLLTNAGKKDGGSLSGLISQDGENIGWAGQRLIQRLSWDLDFSVAPEIWPVRDQRSIQRLSWDLDFSAVPEICPSKVQGSIQRMSWKSM